MVETEPPCGGVIETCQRAFRFYNDIITLNQVNRADWGTAI
jgi:hypothetical protein